MSTPHSISITGNAYPAYYGGRPRARYQEALTPQAKVHAIDWKRRKGKEGHDETKAA